ncbi:response regulator [Candidatus Nanosynbacter sp. BB002]
MIILDVMLPEMNGYEVCRALCQDGNQTLILMLTARDAERDIVEGLDVGADDYLAKPFSIGASSCLAASPEREAGRSLVGW